MKSIYSTSLEIKTDIEIYNISNSNNFYIHIIVLRKLSVLKKLIRFFIDMFQHIQVVVPLLSKFHRIQIV